MAIPSPDHTFATLVAYHNQRPGLALAPCNEQRPDGTQKIFLYLNNAVTTAKGAAAGTITQPLSVILITRGDTILHAWATAGRMGQSSHEVDLSGLRLSGSSPDW